MIHEVMENNTDQKERKKKKRILPFFWWFGGAVAGGGLIALAILLAGKNNQIGDLQRELVDNETAYTKEKESLRSELDLAHFHLDTLKAGYDALSAALAAAQERNARLASTNASYNKQIITFRAENEGLQSSIDKYLTENQSLNERIRAINEQMENLQAQLDDNRQVNEDQAEVISDQSARIASDSAAMAQKAIQEAEENVSGYFNNTFVSGAYGLDIRSVPYSHYFYGGGMINGYVIDRRFATGVGLGLNAYNGGVMMPIYLDFRFNLKKTGLIPYLVADGGLLLNFNDMKEPGLFINPGFGIYKDLSERIAINLGGGLFVQRTPFKSSFVNFQLGLIMRGKKKE